MIVATRLAQLSRVWKMSLLLGLLAAAACAPNPAPGTSTPLPPTATASPTHTATLAPSATATTTTTPAPSSTVTQTPTAEPPTSTATPSATATETPTATATTPPSAPGGGDFAPTSPGRWDTSTPVDNAAGCSSTILAPYGPVIIRPNASGLGWVNTANEDYTLTRLGPNVYQYSGNTTRGDGLVTIGVTFTSATTFNMSRVFAPSAEPGCTHTYAQTGTFEFAVP